MPELHTGGGGGYTQVGEGLYTGGGGVIHKGVIHRRGGLHTGRGGVIHRWGWGYTQGGYTQEGVGLYTLVVKLNRKFESHPRQLIFHWISYCLGCVVFHSCLYMLLPSTFLITMYTAPTSYNLTLPAGVGRYLQDGVWCVPLQ